MKFGKYIQSQQEEWAGPYCVNYKALKKIINTLIASSTSTSIATQFTLSSSSPLSLDSPEHELHALKTAFFYKLERELEKVNSFYLHRENDFKLRLKALEEKKKLILSRSTSGKVTHSLISLKEAFSQFQQDLDKLQKFVELNATAFRKILKKWDKRSKSTTKELYLSRQVEVQPCFNNDILTHMSDETTKHLKELSDLIQEKGIQYTNGNVSSGSVAVPPQSHQNSHNNNTFQNGTDAIPARLSTYSTTTDQSIIDFTGQELEQSIYDMLLRGNKLEISHFFAHLPSNIKEDSEFLSKIFLKACLKLSDDVCTFLIESNNIDCRITDDISEISILHLAAQSGNMNFVKLCLEKIENPNSLDIYGKSPLHFACIHGHETVVCFLLDKINPNIIDYDGYTALVYAIKQGHCECARALLKAKVYLQVPLARNPIHVACQYGRGEILSLLLNDLPANKIEPDQDGLTPLHIVSREGYCDLIPLLIEHGFFIDEKDQINGWTPIFYAVTEGHDSCVQALIKVGARIDVEDEGKWLPWTYALYHGRIQLSKLLHVLNYSFKNDKPVIKPIENMPKPVAPSALFSSNTVEDLENLDLDALPALELPPPIIPFRIYGHSYLDKKYYVKVYFAPHHLEKYPVKFFANSNISSIKLVIRCEPETTIPYSIVLPLKDDLETYSFQVDDPQNFSLNFDVYPTFGSTVIARSVLLSSQLKDGMKEGWNGQSLFCPLFDTQLEAIGELSVLVSIIKPLEHSGLDVGRKVDPYWKSTQVVNHTKPNSEYSIQSLITATSLSEEYIQLSVQVTRDLVPVVSIQSSVSMFGLSLPIASMTCSQYQTLLESINRSAKHNEGVTNSATNGNHENGFGVRSNYSWVNKRSSIQDIAAQMNSWNETLADILNKLNPSIGLCVNIVYDSSSQISYDDVVDAVLRTVYDENNGRSIIFSSYDSAICERLNWKQPNYGVLMGLKVKEGNMSIKEAIHVAKNSNLLGLIVDAEPLIQVPVLIEQIKESGLILCSSGAENVDSNHVQIQVDWGIDAVICLRVFRYLNRF